jgi:hypothetical protein
VDGCSLSVVRVRNAPLRAAIAALLLVGMTAVAPGRAEAACGGGAFGDPNDYARRAGRIADTIILGRLVEIDADANNALHFELVEVYRGEALASPIYNTFESDNGVGIIHVGSCSRGEGVKPGGLFIYATGPRAARFGPMQLVFPRIPHRGWIINHCCEYGSLDELLVLLGVLPATDAVAPSGSPATLAPPPGSILPLGAFLGAAMLVYWQLGKRRNVP